MKEQTCRIESMSGNAIGLVKNEFGELEAEMRLHGKKYRFLISEGEAAYLAEWIKEQLKESAVDSI